MDCFLNPIKKLPEYAQWEKAVLGKRTENTFTGLSVSMKVHFAYLFSEQVRIVYVVPNDLVAARAYADFSFLCGDGAVLLPSREDMLYDVEASGFEGASERIGTLRRLLSGDWKVLVAPIQAAMQFLPAPEQIEKQIVTIRSGDRTEPFVLADKLAAAGYERLSKVEGRGQFAVRGDILDVFPSSSDMPVRIEFFDDEVDSLRYFDLFTQRTTETAEKIEILPKKETNIPDVTCELWIRKRITKAVESQAEALRQTGKEERARNLLRRTNSDLEKMSAGHRFAGIDRYIPFIIGKEHTIFDYAGDAAVFIDNGSEAREAAEVTLEEHTRVCETISEKTPLPAETFGMLMDYSTLLADAKKHCRSISFLQAFGSGLPGSEFMVPVNAADGFAGQLEALVSQIQTWKTQKIRTVVLTETESKAAKMEAFLKDSGLPETVILKNRGEDFTVGILTGGLESGFVYPSAGLAVVSDSAFFKKEKSKTRAKKKSKPILSFADMKPGDYVVHDTHGIGTFDGIETMIADGIRRDYVKIKYADDGVLYVPAYQLETVQKYIGAEGKRPKINKLGGSEWGRTTARVKESLREYAQELVEVYARRSALQGHAFSKDTVWQTEFENSFIYEETEDQLKCCEEIKADMELARPMERLLCGDVGYGKTEVALRAAFKAVCDGKQVAFLVPTTILAQQHYKNFVERFRGFPVKVDYLCRFRTPGERKQILRALAKGDIDILIGTHSLIQKSVNFSDLGLVIIDEEQRFGVLHKERLKILKPEVDILALSATPIPRTLHMSLSGIRDISLIEEPPMNRHPVQTYVAELSPEIIKNAIYREMGRKGQVFYLYNRVKTIMEKKIWLNSVVPEARIGVAHGQMSERELEDTMAAFLEGEYDILLCTTIIESGLDMPNVNTVVVEDGDRLGLAQLYQIRGRVGRSGRTAYAYITYKKDKGLSEVAEKRLQTIREFTEFGSGFKIALRDLEIRGAGSVLGERQHGQLAVVGYDMYCKLLSEVVSEAGGIQTEEIPEVTIDIDINAYISSDFISDNETRLDIYQKIAHIQNEADISDLTDELVDRFGDVPEEVLSLMYISYIRYASGKCGFLTVTEKNENILFVFRSGIKITEVKFLPPVMDTFKGKVVLNAGTEPYITFSGKGLSQKERLREAACFISACIENK